VSAESLSVSIREHYILAPEVPVPEPTYVLKHDGTFGLFNEFGDIECGARHEEGLYHEGTRFLSQLKLRLATGRPLLLSSAVRRDNLQLGADLTNPDIYLDGNLILPRGSLHIYRSKHIWRGVCHERIYVRNFTLQPLEITLVLEFAADFADIFEVRGQQRLQRGRLLRPHVGAGFADLGYEGLDGVTRHTVIECIPPPHRLSGSDMHLVARLEGRSEQVYSVSASCLTGEIQRPAVSYDSALANAERARIEGERFSCDIASSNDRLTSWIDRSTADLNMLITTIPEGVYPYAGVPWFSTTFGRDGLITAMECLWISPHIARGVLAFLAETQAREDDPERDAEPGKILHEARRGEMAALKEIPFGRYYGSVDATPLFVMLAGAYWRRTDDLVFIEGIWPNLRAALRWLEDYGDLDGDGFIEYQKRSPHGLVQQGWKDSHDSIFHADGRIAEGPIALCEVQAYAYAARLAGAELAEALGQMEEARVLREAARALYERFQQDFWCSDLGLYALALDGHKEPCRVRTSNPGHTLFTGMATPERADRIIRSLSLDTFFTGWGIRTVGDREARYNPMSYHNGSVWPHDNALIAAGMAWLPSKHLAMRVLMAQLEASTYFESSRLPELFCGFRRREGKAPTQYPVACSPQAWAAAAVFQILQACLGLSVDATKSQVAFRYPQLPPSIERLSIRGLVVGRGSVDLTLHRYSGTVGLNVERRTGRVDVAMLS
jgi:glycogen debranching enzyme